MALDQNKRDNRLYGGEDYSQENGAEPSVSAKASAAVQRPAYWRDASQVFVGTADAEYHKALFEVQKKLDTIIIADKENQHFKSVYASLAKVLSTVKPILNEHGFLLRQSTGELRTHGGTGGKGWQSLTVATHLTHVESGQWEMVLAPMPVQAMITSMGAAVTYGKRIALLSYLGIATEDSDGMVAIQNSMDQKAADEVVDGIIESLEATKNEKALKEWAEKNEAGFRMLTEASLAQIRQAYAKHQKSFEKGEAAK